jgi:hypothetical protein
MSKQFKETGDTFRPSKKPLTEYAEEQLAIRKNTGPEFRSHVHAFGGSAEFPQSHLLQNLQKVEFENLPPTADIKCAIGCAFHAAPPSLKLPYLG